MDKTIGIILHFACCYLIGFNKVDAKALKDSKLILEGDILITDNTADLILHGNDKRDAIASDIYLWKNGVIPFQFAHYLGPGLRALIIKCMKELHKVTCLKFKPKSDDDQDYIKFISSDGCYSSIGRQSGKQDISIGDGCQTYGHVMHELMHAIGFFHEQSRLDRDLYVKILWWNIPFGAFKNFETYSHGKGDTLGAPYDIHSIMHYDNKAFSKNGDDTVESWEYPNEELGGEKLTSTDILQINKLYSCHKDSCRDKSSTCKLYTNENVCFERLKWTYPMCKKSCNFC